MMLFDLAISYLMILLAELGDKSQLVCLVMAMRYRPWPVFSGALLAFVLMNSLAVLFGAAISNWIPENYLALAVSLLFAFFGLHLLSTHPTTELPEQRNGRRGVLWATFLLILLSELGDKTQLAVVGLSATAAPLAVWCGATLALATTSALGAWAGSRIKHDAVLKWLHRLGGVLFLLFALMALLRGLAILD